jgi:hypothetical protein
MADYSERELQRGVPVGTRVPAELNAELERQAVVLGVSKADVLRMRIRTGRVAKMEAGTAIAPGGSLRRG